MHKLPHSPLPLYFTAFQPLGLRSLISFLVAWQVVFVTGVCAPVFSVCPGICIEVDQPFESSDERDAESELSEFSQVPSNRRGCERCWSSICNIFGVRFPPKVIGAIPENQVDPIVVHGFRACRLC